MLGKAKNLTRKFIEKIESKKTKERKKIKENAEEFIENKKKEMQNIHKKLICTLTSVL